MTDPRPTSVLPEGESVLTRCPRSTFDVICVEDPSRRFPSGCDTWACGWCGPLIARRRSRCLAWAKPERFVTMTLAPADWQALRQKVRKLCLRLRTDGYRVEWAWTVERGSKTGMRHVHALQHGDYIPQAELQERWGAIVHIERVKSAGGAADYALKEAGRVAGYAVKGAGADLAEHLALNGGRGYHASRGYLRGKRVREVEAIVSGADPSLHWVAIPCTTSLADGVALARVALPPASALDHATTELREPGTVSA